MMCKLKGRMDKGHYDVQIMRCMQKCNYDVQFKKADG